MSSPNPFGGPNPFADPAVTVHTESHGGENEDDNYGVPPAPVGAWGSQTSNWASSTGSTGKSNGRKLTATERELSLREEEVRQREKQLEHRQRELQSLQRSTVTGTPAPIKNWPPCSPVLYHDIEAEIPAALQTTVRRGYQAYLLFCGTTIFNFLCLTLGLVKGVKVLAWIFAGIYALVGIPGAFVLWYGRLYNAASYDRSVTFMCFFLGNAIHVGFCVWAAIPIPGIGILGTKDDSSFTGWIEVFNKFDKAKWLGAMYLIGAVLWCANVLFSIYVWQKAMGDFRGRGGVQQVQSEAQAIAGRAIVSSATGSRV